MAYDQTEEKKDPLEILGFKPGFERTTPITRDLVQEHYQQFSAWYDKESLKKLSPENKAQLLEQHRAYEEAYRAVFKQKDLDVALALRATRYPASAELPDEKVTDASGAADGEDVFSTPTTDVTPDIGYGTFRNDVPEFYGPGIPAVPVVSTPSPIDGSAKVLQPEVEEPEAAADVAAPTAEVEETAPETSPEPAPAEPETSASASAANDDEVSAEPPAKSSVNKWAGVAAGGAGVAAGLAMALSKPTPSNDNDVSGDKPATSNGLMKFAGGATAVIGAVVAIDFMTNHALLKAAGLRR